MKNKIIKEKSAMYFILKEKYTELTKEAQSYFHASTHEFNESNDLLNAVRDFSLSVDGAFEFSIFGQRYYVAPYFDLHHNKIHFFVYHKFRNVDSFDKFKIIRIYQEFYIDIFDYANNSEKVTNFTETFLSTVFFSIYNTGKVLPIEMQQPI